MDTCDTLLARDIRTIVITGAVGTLASAIPYGAQLVLQWICIVILRRRSASTSARARNLLLGATLLMTASSTIYVICCAAAPIQDLLDGLSLQDLDHPWTGAGLNATLFLNILIGDIVVFWRAWILWKHKHRMVYIPGILLICTAVVIIGFLLFTIANMGRRIEGPTLPLVYLAFSLSVVTNLVTNLSIGYYTWLHRKAVRGFLQNGNQYARHEKVLTLVLESGVVYTVFLLLGGIISCISLSLDSQTSLTWGPVHDVMTSLGMGMISIYPSLLIVMIFLRKSTWDSAGNVSYVQP